MDWLKRAWRMLLNERGEVATGAEKGAEKGTEKTFTEAQVNGIVQDRVAQVKRQFPDYDTLKEFKATHEKAAEEANKQDLENKKEYEKITGGLEKKIAELSGIITQKDGAITTMRVKNALTTEIGNQNGYVEETFALLNAMGLTEVDKDGNVSIKDKDANGQDVMLNVKDGVTKFLTTRPHLVKVDKKEGGGTAGGGTAGAGGGGGAGSRDVNAVNAELMTAQLAGDGKKIAELTKELRVLIGPKRAL